MDPELEALVAVVVGTVDDMIGEAVVEGTLEVKGDDAAVDVELAEEAVKVVFDLAVLVDIDDKDFAVSEVGKVVGKSALVVELSPASTVSLILNGALSVMWLPLASSIIRIHVADLFGSRKYELSMVELSWAVGQQTFSHSRSASRIFHGYNSMPRILTYFLCLRVISLQSDRRFRSVQGTVELCRTMSFIFHPVNVERAIDMEYIGAVREGENIFRSYGRLRIMMSSRSFTWYTMRSTRRRLSRLVTV